MTELDQRVAVLEEWRREHQKDADAIIAHLGRVEIKVDTVLTSLARYDWLARGAMMALAFLGLATGWIIDKWHIVRGLFK